MTKLVNSGIEVTAIHNHILRASPPTFYMHVAGHGDPEKMAEALREALPAGSKTPFAPPTPTAIICKIEARCERACSKYGLPTCAMTRPIILISISKRPRRAVSGKTERRTRRLGRRLRASVRT
jgi:hypothetical protein